MGEAPEAPTAGTPLTADQPGAERLTGLSSKTLGRMADRGEPVGRIKVGRKVLYHVPSLAAWLAARATTPAHTTPPTP